MTDAITKAPGMDLGSELPQLFRLGKMLCEQAPDFLPQHVDTPGKVVAIILMGKELGIPPMMSLRGLYNYRGNCELYYHTMIGLLRRDGYGIEWPKDEQTETKAVLKLTDPTGAKHTETYTLDDARKAGLKGDNWTKRPKTMLRARATSAAMRGFAGMPGIYARGEISEQGSGSPEPIQVETRATDPGPEETAAEHEWIKELDGIYTLDSLKIWCSRRGHQIRTARIPRQEVWDAVKDVVRAIRAQDKTHTIAQMLDMVRGWVREAPEHNGEGVVEEDVVEAEGETVHVMPFGKHKGEPLSEINRHYLRSMLSKLEGHGDPELYRAVEAVIEQKDLEAKEREQEETAAGDMGFLRTMTDCRDEITLVAWCKEHRGQLGKLAGQAAEYARIGLRAQAEAVEAHPGTVLEIAGLG